MGDIYMRVSYMGDIYISMRVWVPYIYICVCVHAYIYMGDIYICV